MAMLSRVVLVLFAVCFTESSSQERDDGLQALSFLQFAKNISTGTPVLYSYRIMYVLTGKEKEDRTKASVFSAAKTLRNSVRNEDLKTVSFRDKNVLGKAKLLNHFLITAMAGIKYPSNTNGTTMPKQNLRKYLTRKWHGNDASRLGQQVVLKERRKRHTSGGKLFSLRKEFENKAMVANTNVPHATYYNHYFRFPSSSVQLRRAYDSNVQHTKSASSASTHATSTQYVDPARHQDKYGQSGAEPPQGDPYKPAATDRSDMRRAHRFERSPTSSGDDHYDQRLSYSSPHQASRYYADQTPGPISSRRRIMPQYSDVSDYNPNSYLSRQPAMSQREDAYPEPFRSGNDRADVSHFRTEYHRREGYQNAYEGLKNNDENHYSDAHSTGADPNEYKDDGRIRYPYDVNRNYHSRAAPGRHSRSPYYDKGYLSTSNPSYTPGARNNYRRENYPRQSHAYQNSRPSDSVYQNNGYETEGSANGYHTYADSGRAQNDISGRYRYSNPSYEPRYSSHRAVYAAENRSPRDYYGAENERIPRYETNYEQPQHSHGYFPGDRDSGYGTAKGINDYSPGYSTSRDQRQDKADNERRDGYYNRYFTSPRTDHSAVPPRQPYYNENKRTRDYPTDQKYEQTPAYPDTVFNDAYLPRSERDFRGRQGSRYPYSGASGGSGRPYDYHQNSPRFQEFVKNAPNPGTPTDVTERNENVEQKTIAGTFPAETESSEKLKEADGTVEESFVKTHADRTSPHTSEAMPVQSLNHEQVLLPTGGRLSEKPSSDFNPLLSDVQNNESGYTTSNHYSGRTDQMSRVLFAQIPTSPTVNRLRPQVFRNFASDSVSSRYNENNEYPLNMKRSDSAIPVIQKHIIDKEAPNLEKTYFDNITPILQRLDTGEAFESQDTTSDDSSPQKSVLASQGRKKSNLNKQHSGLEDQEILYHTTDSQLTVPPNDDRLSESEQTSGMGYNIPRNKLYKGQGSSNMNPNIQHDSSFEREPNQANRESSSKFFGPETITTERAFTTKQNNNYPSTDEENLVPKKKVNPQRTNIRNIKISQNRIIPRLKRQSPNRFSAANNLYTGGGYLGGRQGGAESSAINYAYGGPQISQSYPGRNYPSLALVPNDRGYQGSSGRVPQFASSHQRNDPYSRGYSIQGLPGYDQQPNYSPYSAYSGHQGTQGIHENLGFSGASSGQEQSYGTQSHQNPYSDGRGLQAQGGGYDIHGFSSYLPQASSSYHPAAYQSSSSAPYSDGHFQGGTTSRGQAYYPQIQSYNSGYPSSGLANGPNNQYISSPPNSYFSSGKNPYQQGPNAFASRGFHNDAYTGQQSQIFGNSRFQNGPTGFSRNEQHSQYLNNPQSQSQPSVYARSQSSQGGQYPFTLAQTKSRSQKHFSTVSKDFELEPKNAPVSKFSRFSTGSYGQGTSRQNVMTSSAPNGLQSNASPPNGFDRF